MSSDPGRMLSGAIHYELQARIRVGGNGLGQKGHTTFADFLAAGNVGKRDIIVEGMKCAEYFAYKDGLPVKTACP